MILNYITIDNNVLERLIPKRFYVLALKTPHGQRHITI